MNTVHIEAPETESHPIALVPQPERARRGPSRRPLPQPLENALEIGGPVSRRIEVGGADGDLRGFHADVAEGFTFHLVHLTATFTPLEEEPFTEALIQILLSNPDASQPGTIAWSLAPDRLEDVVQLSRQLSLNASLEITAIAPVAPGMEAGWSRGKTVDRKQAFLLGGNELRSNPKWQFKETDATRIEGMMRLMLVVKGPQGHDAEGTVKVSASVRRKRLGIFRYDAAVDPAEPPTAFRLT